jgi:hypothetical protein
VELIVLDDHPRLRVSIRTRWGKYLLAYCWDVDSVAAYVDLADLVEVYRFPDRDRRRGPCAHHDPAAVEPYQRPGRRRPG